MVHPTALEPATRFLAGYAGATRTSYTTDLRNFADWCQDSRLTLSGVRRPHLEVFARWMKSEGRMPATVGHRLSTLASFCRYCHVEVLLELKPAANVRRPKVDYDTRTLGLDRNELGALLVHAGIGSARDHALVTMLAMNGLRIAEALGTNVHGLDMDRGHRTRRIVRKGGKHVTIPLAPRTGRALDLCIGERACGIFLGANGARMDCYAPDRTVKRWARRAGIFKRISPHGLHHSFITAALDARSATGKRPPATPTRAPRCATTAPATASTGTPSTAAPRSSLAPAAHPDEWAGRYRA